MDSLLRILTRHRLHFVDVGPREPRAVVLVHGLTATHRYWAKNVEALAQRRRVVALDLPGFGQSEKPDVDYSNEFFVETIAELCDELAIDRVSLVGNSMGGQIAMGFALAHPRRVDRLVLVDPAGVTALPLWLMRVGMWMAAGAGADERRWPRPPRAAIEALFRAVFPTRPDLARRWVDSYSRAIASDDYHVHLRSGFRAARGVLRAPMLQRARQIAAPTLIIWGAKDWLLPVTAARPLRRAIPRSRLLIYRQSGHCPMIDQPDRWNHDVQAFLDGELIGR